MGTSITDWWTKYKNKDIVIQLIFWNALIFLVITITALLLKLFNATDGNVFDILALPASFSHFLEQPWSIVTYMFMHTDFWHILFNMLCLYWFGRIFLESFSSKHLRGLYFLGGFVGGIFFMVAYNLFPYFLPVVEQSVVWGASASVLAIVFAAAYQMPNYSVNMLIHFRLKYLALAVVVIDLLFITSSNAGGHIAHLGGACAGIAFAMCLKKGTDLTKGINVILDFICGLFRTSTWRRKPKMKVHYNTARRESDEDYNTRKKKQNEEIDRILDKLKKSGYEGLTLEEKKYLFDASKR